MEVVLFVARSRRVLGPLPAAVNAGLEAAILWAPAPGARLQGDAAHVLFAAWRRAALEGPLGVVER